ncbi:MAG: hypothetical protein AABX00_01525 [Nanoarchaeota archaeon]
MCFTPIISFLTFAIELALAVYIIKLNPKKSLNIISATILFFLGAYQFSEFGLCTSNNSLLWAKIGFISYTVLPVLGVHWALILKKSKEKIWPVYVLPASFIALAAANAGFVKYAECSWLFVNVVYQWSFLWSWVYKSYYAILLVMGAAILLKSIANENNKKRRLLYILGLAGYFSFTFPTFFFILLLPSFNIYFPSILCHFAILFAIIIAYVIYLDSKMSL